MVVIIGEALQSKTVTDTVSKEINNLLRKEIEHNINFSSVAINFFPPGVSLEEVNLEPMENTNPTPEINIYVDTVRVNFSVLDALRNKMAIKDIIISSGWANITLEKDKKSQNQNPEEIFQKVFNEIPQRLRNIIIEDFDILIDDISLYSQNTEISFFKNTSYLSLDVYNLDLGKKSSINLPQEFLDSISLEAEITRDSIIFPKFEISHELSQLWGSGKIQDPFKNLDNAQLDFKINNNVFLEDFHFLHKSLKPFTGHVIVNGDIQGTIKDYAANIKAGLYDFSSPYIKLKNSVIEFQKRKNLIIAKSVKIQDPDGSINYLGNSPLYDLEKKKLLNQSIQFNVKDLHSQKAFYFLGDTLDPLETIFNGELQLDLKGDDLKIQSARLVAPKLNLKGGSSYIFEYSDAQLLESTFDVNLKSGYLKMKSQLQVGETLADVEGWIGNGRLDVKTTFAKLNLDNISPIAGLKLYGDGVGTLFVRGPLNDVRFDIGLQTQNSKFLDLRIGEMDALMTLHLASSFIEIKKGISTKNKSKFNVKGVVDFKKKTHLDLTVTSKEFDYDDFKDFIYPISSDLDFLPDNIEGEFRTETKIWGHTQNQGYVITSNIIGSNIVYNEESFKYFKANFNYKDRVVRFKNIFLQKEKGNLNGNFSFDTKNGVMDFNANIDKLRVGEFSVVNKKIFGLNGDLFLSAKGSGKPTRLKASANLSIKDAAVAGEKVDDSNISFKADSGKLSADIDIFGKQVEGDFLLDLSKKNPPLVSSWRFNTDKVKEFMSVFMPHNISRKDLYGSITGVFDIETYLNDFGKMNLNIQLEKFNFNSNRILLSLNPAKKVFKIENGLIKNNQLEIRGKDNILGLSGSGSLSNKFVVDSVSKIDASILEMINPEIVKSEGVINGNAKFSSNSGVKKLKHQVVSAGDIKKLTYAGLPASFDNMTYKLRMEDQKLKFENIKGKFGGGDFTASGAVHLVLPFPKLDFSYSIKNSKLRFFNKTNFWISGSGTVKGDALPYKIAGDVSIINGTIYDELSDFGGGGKESYSNKYVPILAKEKELVILMLDLNLKTIRPLSLKNSLAEISFHSSLNINGDVKEPRIKGYMRLVPGTGRFYFKSSDFILRKGDVNFKGELPVRPSFHFEGISDIQEYQIILKLAGNPDDFSVDLSSNPTLPEEDILTLLAIGITSDKRSKLSDSERDSITSLGIGAIIFDRFRINQELQSALGVNLSLSPEINDSDTNYLNKSSSRDSKSATRVSIKKKMNEKVDVSVSSVVGGDVQQKQEMNVNLKVDDGVSIEGVYEVKGGSQSETVDDTDSVGLDLKYRFEF